MLKNEIYDHHCELLDKRTSFHYKTAVKIYSELGNAPGVEPDNLYLYYRLIKDFHLKKIVEFGSGFSTLFFTELFYILKQQKNQIITIQSFEEELQYYELTNKLLDYYMKMKIHPLHGIVTLFNDTWNDNERIQTVFKNCDFLFIDSSIALRPKVLLEYTDYIKDIPFIIVDDYESLTTTTSKFEELANRRNFYVYNGSGRRNRLQYINYLEDNNNSINTIRDYFLKDQDFYLQ
jgi:predicted O-methyltransferase YrrM